MGSNIKNAYCSITKSLKYVWYRKCLVSVVTCNEQQLFQVSNVPRPLITNMFSNPSLNLFFFQVGNQEEFYIGLTTLCIQGIPQLLVLATTMTHWNGDFDTTATDFYLTFIEIPLFIGYFNSYCSPNTKFAVGCKIFVLLINNLSHRWANYMEKYIHMENDVENIENNENKQDIDFETKTNNHYDNSKLLNMAVYQLGYIAIAPFLGKYKV